MVKIYQKNSDDPIKMVLTFQLSEQFTFKVLKKIVLYYNGSSKITDNNNKLRVYIN